MNKLIPLMALALLILVGCAKEEMIPTMADNQQSEESSIWVINTNSETPVWEVVTLNAQSSNSAGVTSRSNSAHAHGNYTGFGGGTTISFSGTENDGGAHGSAEVQQVSGPFEAHYLLETTSMVVDGNYAIYGGIITEVIVNTFPAPPPPPPGVPAPPCNPNSVGNYVYFTVYDNGQGNNAPADQYRGIAQSCSIKEDGGVSFPWFIFGAPSDVMNESDEIKVN
jgi:hypothetical protein